MDCTLPLAPARPHRSIVSYVRRSPRMTPSQQTWLRTYGPRWIVEVANGDLATTIAAQPPLDLAGLFERQAPLVVEIGSGHGDTLVAAAAAQPQTNFLGFEVFEASLAVTVGKIAAAGRTNIRLVPGDAISGLTHLIDDHTIDECWVFFPDPWPKKRHHKRRLVSPAFADLLARKLAIGHLVRLASDQESYAETISATFDADPRFTLISTERFATRPITKFESRGLAAGRTIHDFAYRLEADRS